MVILIWRPPQFSRPGNRSPSSSFAYGSDESSRPIVASADLDIFVFRLWNDIISQSKRSECIPVIDANLFENELVSYF